MTELKERRIGKFYVAQRAVYGASIPQVLARMQFVPLRVDMLADIPVYRYIGMSPMFDETIEGCAGKHYTVDADINKLGLVTDVCVTETPDPGY